MAGPPHFLGRNSGISLMGHSSIEMTVNHYLHFGPLLVADAQCIEESKVSAKIVRALLPVKLFSKQLNTSQVTEKITLKSIVEKLNSSSRIIQEMILLNLIPYPLRTARNQKYILLCES